MFVLAGILYVYFATEKALFPIYWEWNLRSRDNGSAAHFTNAKPIKKARKSALEKLLYQL